MSKLASASCPNCGMPGTLSISVQFVINPPGTFSLAGRQMKVAAHQAPVLGCNNCNYSVVGRIDSDGKAAFNVGAA